MSKSCGAERPGADRFSYPLRKPTPIEARVKAPLVSITAEGDLVTLSFVREYPDPNDAEKKYTTTWFDMFRIVDGKIDEHWDPAVKRAAGARP